MKRPGAHRQPQLIWSVGSRSLLSAIHDGLDNGRGHRGATVSGDSEVRELFRCGGHPRPARWGPVRHQTVGAAARARDHRRVQGGGRRHWSKSSYPSSQGGAAACFDRPVAPAGREAHGRWGGKREDPRGARPASRSGRPCRGEMRYVEAGTEDETETRLKPANRRRGPGRRAEA